MKTAKTTTVYRLENLNTGWVANRDTLDEARKLARSFKNWEDKNFSITKIETKTIRTEVAV